VDRPVAIDLFAGGGGLSYGFEEAGFKVAFACDIDKDAAKIYAANLRETVYIVRDIRRIDPQEVLETTGLRKSDISVLMGGPPCQGFSLMGLRNPNDPRNNLFKEMLRFIDFLRPSWIIIENVVGLLSMERGEPVKAIYRELSKRGYVCKHKILNALHYGVPQRRKRVFFIANRTGDPITFPKPTHGDPREGDLLQFIEGERLNPFFTVRDAIGDLPSLKPGEEKDYYACPPFSEYQRLMREGAPKRLFNHRAPNHTEEVIKRIRMARPGERIPYRCSFEKRRLRWDEPAPTLLDGPRPTWNYAHPVDDRGLSVRERARIMSFPDRFVFVGPIPKQRMVTGNAVPPLMAKAIAIEIKRYL